MQNIQPALGVDRYNLVNLKTEFSKETRTEKQVFRSLIKTWKKWSSDHPLNASSADIQEADWRLLLC